MLITVGVILDKLLEITVAPTSIEVVGLHLAVNLIEIPVVVIKAIDSSHHASPVTATRTVNIKLSSGRVVNQL